MKLAVYKQVMHGEGGGVARVYSVYSFRPFMSGQRTHRLADVPDGTRTASVHGKPVAILPDGRAVPIQLLALGLAPGSTTEGDAPRDTQAGHADDRRGGPADPVRGRGGVGQE